MKVKELVKLLQKCNQEKEVEYDGYSEMILMSVSRVVEGKTSVIIEE